MFAPACAGLRHARKVQDAVGRVRLLQGRFQAPVPGRGLEGASPVRVPSERPEASQNGRTVRLLHHREHRGSSQERRSALERVQGVSVSERQVLSVFVASATNYYALTMFALLTQAPHQGHV